MTSTVVRTTSTVVRRTSTVVRGTSTVVRRTSTVVRRNSTVVRRTRTVVCGFAGMCLCVFGRVCERNCEFENVGVCLCICVCVCVCLERDNASSLRLLTNGFSVYQMTERLGNG